MAKVYLSGPMTGMPDLNFPAFNAEAARLRGLGFDVINPAELNEGVEDWEECLRQDLIALLNCDLVALLPDWQMSKGAHLEMHVAHRVGIRIVDAASLGRSAS